MLTLKNPYIAVRCGETLGFGGSQLWAKSRTVQRYGCGLIAANDLLLYLSRSEPAIFSLFAAPPRTEPILWEDYERGLELLRRRWLPVIPHFGKTGIALAVGLNCCFRSCGVRLHARWGVSSRGMWESAERMIARDIPVILSVGPAFPLFFKRDRVCFYETPGSARPACSTRAHFVTATGIDGEWVQVSSWGKIYYLRRAELDAYTAKHSLPILSNIVYIDPI